MVSDDSEKQEVGVEEGEGSSDDSEGKASEDSSALTDGNDSPRVAAISMSKPISAGPVSAMMGNVNKIG